MRFVSRLLVILWTVWRFGLDDLALSGLRRRRFQLLRRLTRLGRRWQDPRGVRLRLALERLGPIFVKFGQVLSTRRDLLPNDVALEDIRRCAAEESGPTPEGWRRVED